MMILPTYTSKANFEETQSKVQKQTLEENLKSSESLFMVRLD